MSFVDDIGDFFEGAAENYQKIEKELERTLIKVIFSPSKKSKIGAIKSRSKEKNQEESTTAKETLTAVSNQLDNSIKGKFSKGVKQAVKDKGGKYDGI